MEATDHAKLIADAARDLRFGRITVDDFRAVVRTSKAQGAAAHERAHVAALRIDVERFGT